MPIVQDTIHKVEVAGGVRYFRVSLIALAVLGAVVFYNYRCFRNFGTQEAMDSAQLARNISTGKGYTTYFIRPFSMFLLRQQNEKHPASGATMGDLTQVKDRHPDISNPPVYPFTLAGIMKILPFHHAIPEKMRAFWGDNGHFARHQPDFLIAAFNQLLFFAVIVSTFFLARRLFDAPTAWLSAGLLFGTDILWRFSMSGLSTMLLLLIFSGIAWCLVLIEETVREGDRGMGSVTGLAILIGIFCGLGALTRYSFFWIFIPVTVFLVVLTTLSRVNNGRNAGGFPRFLIPSIAAFVFLLLTVPWIIRNIHLSGTPFGTASYFLYDGTGMFPENRLDRALHPEIPRFSTLWFTVLVQKFLANTRQIFQSDLLKLGGGFIGLFFLIGLFIPLNNTAASRFRLFVLGCLPVLVIVQALGRTHLSDDSIEINTENLLVLVAPFVVIFGAQFFWLLLDQVRVPFRELRYAIIALFLIICCAPFIFSFLPPRTQPLAYPPYFPPYIQRTASYLKEDELAMSDIPWALAWYGNVPSVLATEGSEEFVEIDTLCKPVKAIYLTSVTLNSQFLSRWVSRSDGWGYLLLKNWEVALRQGSLGWPRDVNFTVNRVNAEPTPLSLHFLQGGWPQEFLLTARKNPLESK